MSHGRAIARNAAWLMAATAAQKVIAFAVFTLVARLVGVEITGRYFFAVSVTSVFVILTDLGLTPVVIRELAADEERGKAALARALQAKAFLIPLAIVATLTYAFTTQHGAQEWVPIALACFVMSADALSLVWYGAIRGKRQLRYEALGMFVGQVLTGILAVTSAWWLHGGVNGLVIALMAGSFWNVGWSIWQARRLGVRPGSVGSWPWNLLVRNALPFALAGIFVKIYSYVDTLLLKQFHGAEAVGIYAVAYKVTYAFQFLPLTFVAALYPGMSAVYAAKDKQGLQNVLRGSLRLMMMTGVPIAAALSAFAPRIIPFVYGKSFTGSAAPLAILSWVLIPIFLDFPIGSLLNATRRAGLKTTAMGVTMVINAVANIILVPRLGPVGAAWSGVMSFFVLFVVGAWFARHDFGDLRWFAGLMGRGALAAVVIWWLIRVGLASFSLPASILISMIASLFILIGCGLLQIGDIRTVASWLSRKQPAVPATEPVVDTPSEDV